MRRRHRRVLFNVFAFSLLGVSIYLNKYRMNDNDLAPDSVTKVFAKANPKIPVTKATAQQNQKN